MFRLLLVAIVVAVCLGLHSAEELDPRKAPCEEESESDDEIDLTGKKYTLFCPTVPVAFVEAFRLCMDDGQQLATDESRMDSKKLAKLLHDKHMHDPVWLAGSDKGATGSWLWISTMQPVGGIFNYYRWAHDEPAADKHCLTAALHKKQIKWKASDCAEQKCYVCQKNAKDVDFNE